jgi:hypothetical protein
MGKAARGQCLERKEEQGIRNDDYQQQQCFYLYFLQLLGPLFPITIVSSNNLDITYAVCINILFENDDSSSATYCKIKILSFWKTFSLLIFISIRLRGPVTLFGRVLNNCYISMGHSLAVTTQSRASISLLKKVTPNYNNYFSKLKKCM